MVGMDGDLAAIYARIVAEPDEDIHRPVYADRLDEIGDDPARAELIRVQVELSRIGKTSAYDERQHELAVRERNLLAANRSRWLRVECPKCEGTGDIKTSDGKWWPGQDCHACDGTGDACGLARGFRYRLSDGNGTATHEPVRVKWDRGFPHRVEVPGMAGCVSACPDCTDGRWRNGRDGHCRTCGDRRLIPSNWLAAVVTHHPTVLECVPLSVTHMLDEPERTGGVWAWRNSPPFDHDALPDCIAVRDRFLTREAAITALGRAVVKWARKHTKERASP